MSCNNLSSDYEDIDDESRDELLYDNTAMNKKMDEVFLKTKLDPLWIHLYELAAAKFFSTKLEIGLTVLFSYHYFPRFYDCFKSFSETPETWGKRNESYNNLLSIL
jgi:hypothetical protein